MRPIVWGKMLALRAILKWVVVTGESSLPNLVAMSVCVADVFLQRHNGRSLLDHGYLSKPSVMVILNDLRQRKCPSEPYAKFCLLHDGKASITTISCPFVI